ncbi:MAG: hypothetical protein ABIO84_09890 [Lysobacter sp.]
MSRFDRFPDRAVELANSVGELANSVGDRLRGAMPSDVGDRVRRALPSRAGGLLEAGVALGALKTGTRAASLFARRNPTVAVAALAGAGLLWYAAHRRAQKAERGLLEGRSRRVDATVPGDESVSQTFDSDTGAASTGATGTI